MNAKFYNFDAKCNKKVNAKCKNFSAKISNFDAKCGIS